MSELSSKLLDLRLHGMSESIDYRVLESSKSGHGFDDFLTILINDEKLYRTNMRATMLRRRATFKDNVILSDFESDPKRGISKQMIKELQTMNFLKGFENIIFVGGTGVGKSFLAQAIGNSACMSGVEAKFIHINYLFEQYRANERAGHVLQFMKKMSSYKLLIIDDVGLRKLTHEEAIVFYQIIEDRYNKASTIITTQIKTPGLMDLFDDKVIAEAIVDRLISKAHIIEIKKYSEGNYRKNQSPKKKIAIEIEK